MNCPGPGDLWNAADMARHYGDDVCDCGNCEDCIDAAEKADREHVPAEVADMFEQNDGWQDDWDEEA